MGFRAENVITVPGDKVPGDGRDSITFGEDVPPELATTFKAGLFFRPGNYDPANRLQQVKYYGIAGASSLFSIFAYVENWHDVYGDNRLVNLLDSDLGALDVNRTHLLHLGPRVVAANDMATTITTGHAIRHESAPMTAVASLLPGFAAVTGAETPLSFTLRSDGEVAVQGAAIVAASSPISAGVHTAVCPLPGFAKRAKNVYGWAMNASTGGLVRVDARRTGDAVGGDLLTLISPPAIAGNTTLLFNLNYDNSDNSSVV